MNIEQFKEKTILITGGTGSLGKALVSNILERWPDIKKIIIYSMVNTVPQMPTTNY